MAFTIRRAADAQTSFFKILCYGDSGVGKTWRVSQSGEPGSKTRVVGLLTEANGVHTARCANPDILLPEWADGDDEVRHYAKTIGEVREVIVAIQNGVLEADVLVIDGLTEIQQMMKDKILELKQGRLDDDPKTKGQRAAMAIGDWGTLNEWMRRFLRTIRNLRVHIAATALAEVEVEHVGEDATIRHIRPMFQGSKLPSGAAQYFNVVAYCYCSRPRAVGKTAKARATQRLAMVEGSSKTQCKPAPPLGGVLSSPIYDWLAQLAAGPTPNTNSAPKG